MGYGDSHDNDNDDADDKVMCDSILSECLVYNIQPLEKLCGFK